MKGATPFKDLFLVGKQEMLLLNWIELNNNQHKYPE